MWAKMLIVQTKVLRNIYNDFLTHYEFVLPRVVVIPNRQVRKDILQAIP